MDETKKYLVNIESNLKKYAEEAAEAKKKVDELIASNKALKESGTATTAEIEASNAALKNSQDEYRKAANLVKTAIAANQSETGSRKQLGEQLKLQEQALGKLGNAYILNAKGQRELNPLYIEQRKRIAETKQAIIDYDLALKDGRSNIGRYGEAVGGAFKNIAQQAIGTLAPIALVVKAFDALKDAFLATEKGAQILNRVKTSFRVFMNEIVSGNIGKAFFGGTVAEAQKIGDELNRIRIRDRAENLEVAKLENIVKVARFKSVDAMTAQTEQIKNLNIAQDAENKIIEIKKGNLKDELYWLEKLLLLMPNETKLLDEINAKQAEYEGLEGERSFRLESRKSRILQRQVEESEAAFKKRQAEAAAIEELMLKETKAIEDAAKKRAAIRLAEQELVDEETKLMGEKAKQRYEKEIQAGFDYQNLKAQGNLDMLDTLLDQEYGYWLTSAEYARMGNNEKLLADLQYTEAKKQLSQLRIEQEQSELAATARLMEGLSELLGRQTEAGKGFAIAQATINTWLGVSQVIAEEGLSTYMKFIQIAAVIIEGLAAVKNIAAVNTSGSSRSVSMPTAISSTATAQRAFSTPVGSTVFTQPQLSQTQLNAIPSAGNLTAEDIRNIVRNMPPQIVTVEDINARTKAVNKISVRANI